MIIHDLQGFAAVSVCPDPTEASVTVMHHSGIGTMQVSGTTPSLEEFGVWALKSQNSLHTNHNFHCLIMFDP